MWFGPTPPPPQLWSKTTLLYICGPFPYANVQKHECNVLFNTSNNVPSFSPAQVIIIVATVSHRVITCYTMNDPILFSLTHKGEVKKNILIDRV